MKKILLYVLLLGLVSVPVVFAQTTLKLAGVENVSPLIYEENGQLKGFNYDIWIEIANRLGLKAEVELLPFRRLYSYLQTGELDGTLQIY